MSELLGEAAPTLFVITDFFVVNWSKFGVVDFVMPQVSPRSCASGQQINVRDTSVTLLRSRGCHLEPDGYLVSRVLAFAWDTSERRAL